MRVIAAAIVQGGRLLLVSKRVAPDVFYLPGGKPDPGEAPLDCLRRELSEELGVELRDAEPFAEIRAPAALEPVEMTMTVYRATVGGAPAAGGEIAELAWWPDGRELTLAPAVRDHVIPAL